MFKPFKSVAMVAVLVTSAATGIVALAATHVENDAAALPMPKISLSQAITAAEQQANGRATRAELEHSKSGVTYDVEVVSGTKTLDVKVDAEKGTVVATTEDQGDHDDGQDKED